MYGATEADVKVEKDKQSMKQELLDEQHWDGQEIVPAAKLADTKLSVDAADLDKQLLLLLMPVKCESTVNEDEQIELEEEQFEPEADQKLDNEELSESEIPSEDEKSSEDKDSDWEPSVSKPRVCARSNNKRGAPPAKRTKNAPPAKSHSCKVCYKEYKSESLLKSHTRLHSGHKPYHCHMCLFSTAHKGRLASHVLTHTGEKPHACKHCGHKCRTKSALTSHMKTHGGAKPYTCDVCKKSFTKKSSLIVHIRSHSGQRPHRCEHCDSTFTSHQHLNNHIAVHFPKRISCSQCDFKCSTKYTLKVHARKHTGEKPFQCDVCLQKFRLSEHLRNHKKKPCTLSS